MCIRDRGKADDSDEEGDDDGEAAEEEDPHVSASTSPPLLHHLLPISVVSDFMEANKVRHVIDMTPTPLPLSQQVIEKGCSYFGVCGSEFQRDFLLRNLKRGVVDALQDPTSPLTDPRFLKAEPQAKEDVEDIEEEDPEDDPEEDPDNVTPKVKAKSKAKSKANQKRKGKSKAKVKALPAKAASTSAPEARAS